jgi:CMP/dCMP kinase
MTAKITIAIDGYAACGKSTLAKALAKKLGYIYVDSGAMYRATTLYFLNNKLNWNIAEDVRQALANVHIEFAKIGTQTHTFLNGEDVEQEIRTMRVSNQVSYVSSVSAVRKMLVRRQQEMGAMKGLAMDGRDIGTVVFKDAELKLFMTASIEARTQRRLDELHSKGVFDSDMLAVENNLTERDRIDSSREDSPLSQAKDAVIIDNTNLSPEEQFNMALELARTRIAAKIKRLELIG